MPGRHDTISLIYPKHQDLMTSLIMANKIISKIKRTSPLKEQVCESLRQAVLQGFFGIGDHITEEKVAEFLGVSRTPVREALSTLAHEGILRPRERQGYDLFIPTAEKMEQTYQVRELLEPLAIESVVRLTNSKHLEILKSNIGTEDIANKEEYPREFSIQNLNFRLTLYEKCSNIYMQEILTKFDHYSFYLTLWTIRANRTCRKDIVANQRHIFKALKEHDIVKAKQGVLDYINMGRKYITKLSITETIHRDS